MLRRNFISRAVMSLSAAAVANQAGILSLLPPAAAAPGAEGASLEQQLAAFSTSIRFEDLPQPVLAAVKQVLLDTIGCAFGAVGTDAATIAESTIRKTFGDGTAATVIGYQRPATLEGAAFVNGVLVRSLDLNDTYLGTEPLHPSEIVPTALALAEDGRVNGKRFIEALVAGYEASMRVTDAISFIERGFHPLCAMAYATPLIAGKLWNLKPDAIAHATGISAARGYTSFVVNSGAISMMKAMGFAATAADGLFATRLAAQGFTGPADTLDWFASKTKPGQAKVSVDLETGRYRLPRVAFKRFPIQIELAAVAEAGSTLSPMLKGRAPEIREIIVETYPGIIERVADAPKFKPQTKGTADHSLPVCLAMALLDGDVTLRQFDANRWRDAEVMALVEKTTVKPGAALMAKLPKGRGATIAVVLTNGQMLTETVEVPEGDPQRPLSRASLERKFMTFAEPVVGAETARSIIARIDRLDEQTDMREFAQLLKGPGQQKPT